MRKSITGGLLSAALALAAPSVGQAQFTCGGSCGLPAASCGCAALQPTIETSFRQENVLTYQDVARVGLRQETRVEGVPVTTFEQVTLDEGSYQMVWVPRPVTRTIARTTLQPRLTQRTIPYTYTERVPQIAARLVPQQTVLVAPRSLLLSTTAPTTVLRSTTVLSPAFVMRPVHPVISSAPLPGASMTASEGWTKVPSPVAQEPAGATNSSGVELQSPIVPDPLPIPEVGYDDSVPAPSAARVWQSTLRTVPARW